MPKKISFGRHIASNFRNIDQYSETINFNFDGGKANFKTYMGATLTLILYTITLTFAINRLTTMVNHVNSDVSISTTTDFFTES